MLDIKKGPQAQQSGGQKEKLDGGEHSGTQPHGQQKSKSHLDVIRDLGELLRLNEHALASLRETEAEVRHIRAAIYVLLRFGGRSGHEQAMVTAI
jgi:hypothetical protein